MLKNAYAAFPEYLVDWQQFFSFCISSAKRAAIYPDASVAEN